MYTEYDETGLMLSVVAENAMQASGLGHWMYKAPLLTSSLPKR